jgi:hypothetical protein
VADPASLAVAGERARSAVEAADARWIRSVYLPEDDACLLVFEFEHPAEEGDPA